MSDERSTEDTMAETVDGALSPGSSATGGGTSMGTMGTTEADISDGSDQKLPKIEGDASVS